MLVETPPVWVADELRQSCFNCKARFSAKRRRHHCRSCGEVFCASCWGTKVVFASHDVGPAVAVDPSTVQKHAAHWVAADPRVERVCTICGETLVGPLRHLLGDGVDVKLISVSSPTAECVVELNRPDPSEPAIAAKRWAWAAAHRPPEEQYDGLAPLPSEPEHREKDDRPVDHDGEQSPTLLAREATEVFHDDSNVEQRPKVPVKAMSTGSDLDRIDENDPLVAVRQQRSKPNGGSAVARNILHAPQDTSMPDGGDGGAARTVETMRVRQGFYSVKLLGWRPFNKRTRLVFSTRHPEHSFEPQATARGRGMSRESGSPAAMAIAAADGSTSLFPIMTTPLMSVGDGHPHPRHNSYSCVGSHAALLHQSMASTSSLHNPGMGSATSSFSIPVGNNGAASKSSMRRLRGKSTFDFSVSECPIDRSKHSIALPPQFVLLCCSIQHAGMQLRFGELPQRGAHDDDDGEDADDRNRVLLDIVSGDDVLHLVPDDTQRVSINAPGNAEDEDDARTLHLSPRSQNTRGGSDDFRKLLDAFKKCIECGRRRARARVHLAESTNSLRNLLGSDRGHKSLNTAK